MVQQPRHRVSSVLLGMMLAAGVLVMPAAAFAQNFVGAERCKSRHEFAFKLWTNGPHARAHVVLTDEQRKDPKCNQCHTLVPGDDRPRFAGVQCERCHGPGRYYHLPFVMKDHDLATAVGLVEPKPEHCEQCHNEGAPSIQRFDFATMWARIDHGREAEKKWREQRSAAANGNGGEANGNRTAR